MTEPPDSPIETIRVEHQNGEERILRGEQARAWFDWVVKSINYSKKHGGTPPNIEWQDE